jgi:hypothetical protein
MYMGPQHMNKTYVNYLSHGIMNNPIHKYVMLIIYSFLDSK